MFRLIGACVLACCLSCVPAAAQAQHRDARQVRSSTRWGLDLVDEGCQKSALFSRLVEDLRETDLIVYVERARQLPGVAVAVTELIGKSGPARYLRIWIGTQAMRKRLIALLGHELQHALEIGHAPEVIDEASLAAFYRRNGDLSVDGYDSEAARRMGEAILRELWSGQRVTAAPEVRPAGAVTRN